MGRGSTTNAIFELLQEIRQDIRGLDERLRQVEIQLKRFNGIDERVRRLEEAKYKILAVLIGVAFLGGLAGRAIWAAIAAALR
jgi:hypothetical protein